MEPSVSSAGDKAVVAGAATAPTPQGATVSAGGTATPETPGAKPQTAPPPANRVEVGYELRLRQENWNNLSDYNDDASDDRRQFRFRQRLWGKLNLGSKAEFMLGLNNESRGTSTPATPFTWDETIFETLYADYRFSAEWSARLGRQDIQRGEGFIIYDGTPGDGSRTAYVNALDLSYAPGKSRFELMVISDPWHDIYLPRTMDKIRPLIEWDEQALGLYYTGSSLPGTTLEGYYFYKTEKTPDSAPLPGARDRRLHTLGGRIVRQWNGGWSVTGELAGQTGTQEPDISIRAWGGYVYGKKTFDVGSKPSFSIGYIGMSGDDPSSSTIEGWDPLFARWPKWSDLMLYGLTKEQGVGYWSNLSMWRPEFQIVPIKQVNLRATYFKVGAFYPSGGSSKIFADGKDRGDDYQVRADWKMNEQLRGHVVYERLIPGDFYTHADPAWFLRFEVIITFKKTLPLSHS